jgi:hypothetical protein
MISAVSAAKPTRSKPVKAFTGDKSVRPIYRLSSIYGETTMFQSVNKEKVS